jgi:hypothetical protein
MNEIFEAVSTELQQIKTEVNGAKPEEEWTVVIATIWGTMSDVFHTPAQSCSIHCGF